MLNGSPNRLSQRWDFTNRLKGSLKNKIPAIPVSSSGGVVQKIIFSVALKMSRSMEAEYALKEVHEDMCESHVEKKVLAYKLLRQDYY